MRVYIETYGCALNRGDSAIMATVLSERGHEITENLNEAEVVVINTCAVRLETEERMKQRIRELRRTGKRLSTTLKRSSSFLLFSSFSTFFKTLSS